MSTITGNVVHTPVVVVGYDSSRESRSIVHTTIIGTDAVTLRKPSPRTGTLVAIFADEATARTCETDLANPRTFVLTRDDLADGDMTFIVDGNISVTLDTEAFVWTLTISYRQV